MLMQKILNRLDEKNVFFCTHNACNKLSKINNIMRKFYRVGILIIIIAYHADAVDTDDVVEIINS